MKLSGRPVAAFDPDGLIFAAGINSEAVKLYDLRSFEKGPFSSFKFAGDGAFLSRWHCITNKQLIFQLTPKISSGLV